VYDKEGELKRKEMIQTQPCVEIELDGKKRSYRLVEQLNGH
jgi:hypothetical protein